MDGREPMEQKATISVREASRLLGTGLNQTYEACRQGTIPTIKVGKRILIPRPAFERLLAGEPCRPTGPLRSTA